MHLKSICQEVDWLFPTWNTAMTWRKRKKLIGTLLFLCVGFLRGESVWSLSYPVLLQSESQESPGQSEDPEDPQTGWSVTASWRQNPQAGRGGHLPENWVPGQVKACRLSGTSRPLSRLRCDNLSRTRSLGRLRHVELLGPWAGGSLSRLRHDNLPGISSLGRQGR